MNATSLMSPNHPQDNPALQDFYLAEYIRISKIPDFSLAGNTSSSISAVVFGLLAAVFRAFLHIFAFFTRMPPHLADLLKRL